MDIFHSLALYVAFFVSIVRCISDHFVDYIYIFVCNFYVTVFFLLFCFFIFVLFLVVRLALFFLLSIPINYIHLVAQLLAALAIASVATLHSLYAL